MIDYKELIKSAYKARTFSYSPYSHFEVGAALLCENGSVYLGCNIENAAFSPTNCAERTAVFKAISDGNRYFKAIAIVGGKHDADTFQYCAPCGVCRQVLMEFCDPESFEIILSESEIKYEVLRLKDLLPLGFSGKDIK